ncbi:MAG: hypothetical protein ACXVJL_14855 [Candidatus Angelobacter sp.]
MKRPSLSSIAAIRPMWVLRLASMTILALTPLQAKAQKEVPAATAQKIPPNVKTHVLTADELKKSQRESLRQSKATPGRLIRNPAVASKRLRPEVLTILQQQKAFVSSRAPATTSAQTHPSALLATQTPPAAGTAMNSGTPGNSAQSATSGMLSRSTPLLAPQAQTTLARPMLQGQAAPAAGTPMNSGHPNPGNTALPTTGTKASSNSRVAAAQPRTLSKVASQNQVKPEIATVMSSGRPNSSNSAQPATGKTATTTTDPRLLAPQPLRTITPICQSPLITDVNGQGNRAVFTPQPEYNSYVIKGCFFGINTGQIYLVGKFNALKINLLTTFWTDNEIDARLDPNVAGELDQDNVSLVVAPPNGQQIKVGGFKFYAVRSEPAVLLPSIPQAWAWLSMEGGNVLDKVEAQNEVTVYLSPVTSDAPPSAQGTTVYVSRWDAGTKFKPVSDLFFFDKLAAGWNTDSFQVLPFDKPPGCLGVVTYRETFGTWDPEWNGDNIRINWADTSCSGFIPEPPVFPLVVSTYSNITGSAYALNVWARGPRCTDAYTGQLQQQCVQNVRNCGKETCGH